MILGAIIDTRTIPLSVVEEVLGEGAVELIEQSDLNTDIHLDEVLPGLHVIHVICYEFTDDDDDEEE